MKHKLNTIISAIMVACFSSASITSFATYSEVIGANDREFKQDSSNVEKCCNVNVCDSINMPVFIVDGVEVKLQDLDNIPAEDIEKVEVIKDENIKRIFSPRLGGIMIFTTKSKRFLKPVLDNYNRMIEEKEQNRIPGQLLIRGDSIRSDSTYQWPIYEIMPSFPGGESALYEFLESNKQYPEESKRNNEHGLVIVTFCIEKDGTVTNPCILRGRTPSLDDEALRLVSIMPKWMPGTMCGEPKRVAYNLPIKF
ncbi:MAG: TonB family protein [Bacteroides sp.]|nr:TonB family protein [Bacteroides sp.]